MAKIVSFIIPSYNSAKTIEKTLNSIFDQKFSDLAEVIVIDDCSTDETYESLERYNKKNNPITISQLKHNSGPGIARDKGVSLAQCDWISFVDSDDQISKNFIETIKDNIASVNQLTDIVAFNYSYKTNKAAAVRDDLKLLTSDKKTLIQGYLLDKIENLEMLNFFRKDFLTTNKISHRSGIHEDIDFLFHCFLAARNIEIIDKILYIKCKSEEAITASFGVKHIEGYFDALKRIYKILSATNNFEHYHEVFKAAFVNLASSRMLMIVNNKHRVIDSLENIYAALSKKTEELAKILNIKPRDFLLLQGSLKTKYQIIFEKFLRIYESDSANKPELLLTELNKIKNKTWSCYDLHNSVFLAPNEIRTCCKRYYHNGQLKGDVVLYSLEKSPDTTIVYDDIKRAKNKLYKEINRDSAPECEACPFLKFDDWGGAPLSQDIKYLSFEHHSLCNMRCTYCSDAFYGGKKSYYDINKLVDSFIENNAITNCDHIVWGGGEPTVDQNFPRLLNLVSDSSKNNNKQRIITNCTIYSEALAKQIKDDKAYIVVSIDAGTQETFEKVRKYKYFDKVLDIVKKYSEIAPNNLVIKYIITKENYHLAELEAFTKLMVDRQLQDCSFQISYNFYNETVEEKYAIAIATLYSLLLKSGVSYLFLDDLIWQRLPHKNQEIKNKVIKALSNLGISEFIADSKDYPNVAIWGTGRHYELLAKESEFLAKINIEYFIDTRPEYIGKKIAGKNIFSPEKLLDDSLPIIICAVQAAPLIYQQIKEMSIDQNRIIKKMIL